jgi:replicative DNA helicase
MADELSARILAEESLLGAILIEATATHSLAIRQVANLVNHTDFSDASDYFSNRRSRIFKAMTQCEHPEVVSVAQRLVDSKQLKSGDLSYLSHLIAECPTSLDYLWYAKAVRKYARGNEPSGYAGLKL